MILGWIFPFITMSIHYLLFITKASLSFQWNVDHSYVVIWWTFFFNTYLKNGNQNQIAQLNISKVIWMVIINIKGFVVDVDVVVLSYWLFEEKW